jgi:hypothetical protein
MKMLESATLSTLWTNKQRIKREAKLEEKSSDKTKMKNWHHPQIAQLFQFDNMQTKLKWPRK